MVDKNTFVDNHVDLQRRIENTVILYDRCPVLVTFVENMDRINILKVEDKMKAKPKTKVVALKDPLLDVNPFKLGYVNTDAECGFFTRRPYRGTQIGLLTQKIRCEPWPRAQHAVNMIYTEGFRDMVLGVYPKLAEAVDCVSKFGAKSNGMAFNRLWAVRKDNAGLKLEFRGKVVGYHKGNLKFELFEPTTFTSSMTSTIREHLTNARL